SGVDAGQFFVLAQSLSLEDEVGAAPVGALGDAFAGTFDGAGRALVGLAIHRPDDVAVGLFGVLDASSVIFDLQLVDFAIVGQEQVGILAGRSAGTVTSVEVSGTVEGESYVGGLLGWSS